MKSFEAKIKVTYWWWQFDEIYHLTPQTYWIGKKIKGISGNWNDWESGLSVFIKIEEESKEISFFGFGF